MTEKDTLGIMSVLKAAYPSYYREMRRSEAFAVVGLWQSAFRDEPVSLVAQAVRDFIAGDAKGFPPSIGAIKQAVLKLPRRAEPETAEWAALRREWARLRAMRRAAGLPETACQAMERGMSGRDYLAALDRAKLALGGGKYALDG